MKIGDQVIMNGNYYVPEKNRGKVFTVRSRPFPVCGTVCVLLEGYSGGYAADGLSVVVGHEVCPSPREEGKKECPRNRHVNRGHRTSVHSYSTLGEQKMQVFSPPGTKPGSR